MKKLEELLNLFRNEFNFKTLSNGTELICHTPDIGKDAWLHEVYYKLDYLEINELQNKMNFIFPEEYKNLLTICNGFNFFSDSMSVFGARKSYKRIGDESHQPYDLYDMNLENRKNKNLFVIGSCDDNENIIAYDKINNIFGIYHRDTYQLLDKFETLTELLEKKINELLKQN